MIVAFIPETLGTFNGLIYIALDSWLFLSTVHATIIPSSYELKPLYFTDILVNERFESPIYVTNPVHLSNTLII